MPNLGIMKKAFGTAASSNAFNNKHGQQYEDFASRSKKRLFQPSHEASLEAVHDEGGHNAVPIQPLVPQQQQQQHGDEDDLVVKSTQEEDMPQHYDYDFDPDEDSRSPEDQQVPENIAEQLLARESFENPRTAKDYSQSPPRASVDENGVELSVETIGQELERKLQQLPQMLKKLHEEQQAKNAARIQRLTAVYQTELERKERINGQARALAQSLSHIFQQK